MRILDIVCILSLLLALSDLTPFAAGIDGNHASPPEPLIIQRGPHFVDDTPTLLDLIRRRYGYPNAHLLTTHLYAIEDHELKDQILGQQERRKIIQLGDFRDRGKLGLVMPIHVPPYFHDAADQKWFVFFGLHRRQDGQKMVTVHGYAKLGNVEGIEAALHNFDVNRRLDFVVRGKTLNRTEVLYLLRAYKLRGRALSRSWRGGQDQNVRIPPAARQNTHSTQHPRSIHFQPEEHVLSEVARRID